MTLRELIVTAEEDKNEYTLTALELPTGECVVFYETTNDGWFLNRLAIRASGEARVTGILETGETVEWTNGDLMESLRASAREFSPEAIPESLRAFVRKGAPA